jgi:hypothetical protein
VLAPSILARKSEEGLLPCQKIGLKLVGNSQPGPVVSGVEPVDLLLHSGGPFAVKT